jgi:hypothetical protein
MEHFVGLDVSLKLTAICIVDQTGKIEREGVVASNPEAFIKSHAPHVARMFVVRLRYGPSPGTAGPIAPKASLAGSGLVSCRVLRHQPMCRQQCLEARNAREQ